MYYHKKLDRRQFLRQASLTALAGLTLPGAFNAALARPAPAAPVRIRGAVRAGSRGVAGIRVTDGLTVARTAGDGSYELVSTGRQRHVYLTAPAGYEIPRNATGTARFYQPIQPDASGEMDATFDLGTRVDDDRHAFFVLADTQMQNNEDFRLFGDHFVPDFRESVARVGRASMFGVGCGDIMWDDLTRYGEYEAGVAQSGIPFFQVVGNHDLDFRARSDAWTTQDFERHFGPTYYSFDRGAVHYVVLDDVFWHGDGYIGYVGEDQLAWLEQDLTYVEPGGPVVVFIHIPALSKQYERDGEAQPGTNVSVTNREVLYDLLAPYRAHLISGHTHVKEHIFEGGTHEHIAGAVCGAWWTGPLCSDGTPQGYDVFEIEGEAVRWRYKATGYDDAHQLRVYPHGSDLLAPDEIVANVWDWDPQWTVVWYEDGARRGVMARRTGRDPLAVTNLSGPELPPRRPWVDPGLTSHLFYAPAAREAGSITVEATDGFGRVYTATMEPGT